MKKTNKFAKRVLSVVLTLSIVLSFALINVSALPSNYTLVENKIETYNFDVDNAGFSGINTTIGVSDEKFHGDSGKSLKFTGSTSNNGLAKIAFTPKNGFEANSTYYISFWFLSEQWTPGFAGADDNIVWDTHSSNGSSNIRKFSEKAASKYWRKAWVQITTGNTPDKTFNFGCYGSEDKGTVIYVDDFEFAKVDGANIKANGLPTGAEVIREATKDFDLDKEVEDKYLAIKEGNATRIGVTFEKPHWGERSFAIKGNSGNTGSVTYYFHPRLLMPAMNMGGSDDLTAGTYYISCYVSSPDEDITVSAVSNGNSCSVISPSVVEQGDGWTKVSGTFTLNDKYTNSGIIDITVAGLKEGTVYFDDFYFAEIQNIQDAVGLTSSVVEYDLTSGIATVKIESDIELKSASVVEPEGVMAVLSEDGNEITVDVAGLAANSEYRLLLSVRDAYDRLVSRYVTFKTPMVFAGSSIANGATDVLAPVAYIYIDAPTAIEESTVVAENFTITNGASVTAVELKDADTIKVSLDGTLPSTEYKLSVDNVTDAEGTVLKDSITFTTKKSEHSYKVGFEGEDVETAVPAAYFRITKGYTNALDTEVYHGGSQAMRINANTIGLGNVKFELYGMRAGHTYRVTFYYKADTDWAGNLSGSEWGTYGTPIISEADENGWKKCQVDITTESGAFKFGLESFLRKGSGWANTGTLYLDDFTVTQISSTLSEPIITKDGSCVDDISAGAVLELPLNVVAADKTVNAYVVEYDTNMKMISVTPYAKTVSATDDVIEITIPDTSNKTKVIIVDGTTFKPLCGAYETK